MNTIAKITAPARLSVLLFALLTMAFANCKKDHKPSLSEELVGRWKVTSYTVDGTEVKGPVVSNSDFKFKETSENKGEFVWNIYFTDGTSDSIAGDYEVDEKTSEVTMDAEGEVHIFDMDLDGDELELGSTFDDMRHELKAKRD